MAIQEEKNGHNYFNRGLTFMKLVNFEDNYRKAEEDLLKALQAYAAKDDSAGQYKVRYNLGINYRSRGKLLESVEAFRKAIELNVNDSKPSAYNNSGLSNFEFKQYGLAVKDFNQAIKKSGGLVAVHFNNRGLAFYHMQENSKALEDFGKAIQLNGSDANVFFNRGNVYLHLNDFDKARSDFDQAIKLEPTKPKFYHAKGLAFEAQAIYIENCMLANPTEAPLDSQGYPIQEEVKTPNMDNISQADQKQLFTNAPNQEISRIKLEIFPLVFRAIKCYYMSLKQDETFLESRFHAALML